MGYAHGIEWTEDKIKYELLKVIKGTGLQRMPSRSECVEFCKNNKLANAITRHGGWYKWAEKLGLALKGSETKFGKDYEMIAANLLRKQGFAVCQMPQNFPYDLLIDNCVKVDVKASKLYHAKNGNFYSFNLEKPYATCDFYILFTVNAGEEIQRIMVVPSSTVVRNNQISVGENDSKYHKFTDKYGFIEDAVEFWGSMQVK